ncbi:alpha/beta hydrolase [uncultured Dietzia sp.]|uniref:alpha/beta hydrolase n=1 Tax=uncultured Dietzia sp. TaxID=395519 RepID=UPI0025CDCC15|nr:alpha/beta hydrolase [uncultured Dietzia sp.]
MTKVEREFVGLPSTNLPRAGAGGHPCQGVYHKAAGTTPRIAVIATHYNIDFSEHYMSQFLAERGFGFLGWNTRFRGAEQHFILDAALSDIGVGVRWLREQAGVEKVILLGNSGGGSLMAAYHSQSVAPSVTALPGMNLTAGVNELPRADGYISSAAHLGRPEVLTSWMDGAVVDENDPLATDESLDLFVGDNGPPYSAEFVERYRAAQERRNYRITEWVVAELERLKAAGYHDRPFSVCRTWADPRMVDPTLEPTNREPNLCYAGVPERANRSVFGIASGTTLRSWLSLWSLEHSQTRAYRHLPNIEVPALVINGNQDTGVFPSDAQSIFDQIGSSDKQLHTLEANHYFLNPGARDVQADLIADWIRERFE